MVFAEEIQYVTRQELLAVATLIVSLIGIIIGILIAIFKGTMNMKVLSLIQDSESKTNAKSDIHFAKVESEMSEIKDNYLSRFERQYEMLSLLRESITEIRTEIKKDLEYIKRKLEN